MSPGSVRVAFDFVGCKLNQAETELLARQFAQAGYRLVSPEVAADVYILNTCTVTHVADAKCRHRIRLAHRRNPEGVVVAIGCYAQRVPDELARLEGVKLVLGNGGKSDLLRLLEESGWLSRPDLTKKFSALDAGLRTRAFIKIQDGCSSRCAYCIVPLVRGRERSIPVEGVITEIKQRVAEGYKEVVLTGTKIGQYNDNGVKLVGLLERILAQTDVERLRLSSLQPSEISPQLIGLWRDGRLCQHFHLSLQSGSDRVLHRMRRGYNADGYLRAVAMIREMVPGAAITSDIIVGFPGETEAEFEESYRFCQKLGFARLHVFPYSLRLGTEAALMPNQVEDSVKQERSRRMLALAEEVRRQFSRRFLGKALMVLWEKQNQGIWTGLTDNYIRVYTRSEQDLTNQLSLTRLTRIEGDVVWGQLEGGIPS